MTTIDDNFVISMSLAIIVFMIIGFYFPIKDKTGTHNKLISVMLAVLVFPVYLILFTLQNPYVGSDRKPNVLVSLLVLFIFWPAIFFVADTSNEIRVKSVSKEGEFV